MKARTEVSEVQAKSTHFSVLTETSSESCYQLHLQGQPSPWSRKIFNDCLSKPYFAYTLSQQEQLLGYYIAMTVLDEVTLMDIVVQPSEKGKGYGKALLQHLITRCHQTNMQQIWLEVRESNAVAIHIYEQLGFVLVEQRMNYYPTATGKEDALIMCLYLG